MSLNGPVARFFRGDDIEDSNASDEPDDPDPVESPKTTSTATPALTPDEIKAQKDLSTSLAVFSDKAGAGYDFVDFVEYLYWGGGANGSSGDNNVAGVDGFVITSSIGPDGMLTLADGSTVNVWDEFEAYNKEKGRDYTVPTVEQEQILNASRVIVGDHRGLPLDTLPTDLHERFLDNVGDDGVVNVGEIETWLEKLPAPDLQVSDGYEFVGKYFALGDGSGGVSSLQDTLDKAAVQGKQNIARTYAGGGSTSDVFLAIGSAASTRAEILTTFWGNVSKYIETNINIVTGVRTKLESNSTGDEKIEYDSQTQSAIGMAGLFSNPDASLGIAFEVKNEDGTSKTPPEFRDLTIADVFDNDALATLRTSYQEAEGIIGKLQKGEKLTLEDRKKLVQLFVNLENAMQLLNKDFAESTGVPGDSSISVKPVDISRYLTQLNDKNATSQETTNANIKLVHFYN